MKLSCPAVGIANHDIYSRPPRMTTTDVFIQHLAELIYRLETQVLADEDDRRLLAHWLKLYRLQSPSHLRLLHLDVRLDSAPVALDLDA